MELAEVGTKFDLTPMVPPSATATFQHSAFWRDMLPRYNDGDYSEYALVPTIMKVRLCCFF